MIITIIVIIVMIIIIISIKMTIITIIVISIKTTTRERTILHTCTYTLDSLNLLPPGHVFMSQYSSFLL